MHFDDGCLVRGANSAGARTLTSGTYCSGLENNVNDNAISNIQN